MEPTAQDVAEARDALAGLPPKRAVQVYQWLFAPHRRRDVKQVDGQLAITPPRPEVCPDCAEVVCDPDCDTAQRMGWPTEADEAVSA
jgi:hypothetical protein